MRKLRQIVVGSVAVIGLGLLGALGGATRLAQADTLSCPAGEDLDNGLCYARCKPGFDRVGTTCIEKCKVGTKDTGKLCVPPPPQLATPKASYSLPPPTPARGTSKFAPVPTLAPTMKPIATATATATPTSTASAAPSSAPTTAPATAPSGHAFSSTEISALLTAFNNERALPKSPPQSTPLPAFTWDTNLATTALTWANTCTFAHNPSRATTGFTTVGETLFGTSTAYASTTPTQAVSAWVAEKTSYTYVPVTGLNVGPTAQYTQVIWQGTTKVGCAYATCSSTFKAIVVCNYGSSGNVIGQYPYTSSTP